MNVRLLLIFIFPLYFIASASATYKPNMYNLTELRQKYLKASQDSEAGKEFNKLMNDYTGKDPVVLAYKAASEATMAKYAWNPYLKLKHLKVSAELFDEAVKLNKSHPEIRFLRFTVEHYIPRYLKMSEHLTEDKKIIIGSLQKHPDSGFTTEWARTMRDFMLSKDHCTKEEKDILQSLKI